MCGVQNCPLAFRETLALRKIVNELTEGSAEHALNLQLDAGRLLFDVAVAIGLDPWSVLNPAIMTRLLDEDVTRLWPTLTEAEHEELLELENIRQSDLPNGAQSTEDQDGLSVGWSSRRLDEYIHS